MFIVTSYWRGSLHIDPMRMFQTELEAQKYAHDNIQGPEYAARIYELSSDAPPKRIKYKPPVPVEL